MGFGGKVEERHVRNSQVFVPLIVNLVRFGGVATNNSKHGQMAIKSMEAESTF